MRYMDDTIIIVKDYKEGKNLLDKYKVLATSLNIKINDKKSYIVPINRTFKYCKWRYKLLKTGKIVRIPCILTIRRQKVKLNKIKKLNLSKEEINTTRIAFKAYLSIGNTYRYKESI